MSLEDALEEDRAARESAHAEVLNRFVVPAARLAELPDDHAPLSVVLSGVDDAGAVAAADGVAAVELVLDDPRRRRAALIPPHRALEPLGVETYFELVLDEGWRDSVPATI